MGQCKAFLKIGVANVKEQDHNIPRYGQNAVLELYLRFNAVGSNFCHSNGLSGPVLSISDKKKLSSKSHGN